MAVPNAVNLQPSHPTTNKSTTAESPPSTSHQQEHRQSSSEPEFEIEDFKPQFAFDYAHFDELQNPWNGLRYLHNPPKEILVVFDEEIFERKTPLRLPCEEVWECICPLDMGSWLRSGRKRSWSEGPGRNCVDG